MMLRRHVELSAKRAKRKYRSSYGSASNSELLEIIEEEVRTMEGIRYALKGLYKEISLLVTKEMSEDAEGARKIVDDFLVRLNAALVDMMRGKSAPAPQEFDF